MNCPKCNAVLSAESRFCTQCGTPAARPSVDGKDIAVHNILLALISVLFLALLVLKS